MIKGIFQRSEERYKDFVKQWCDSHPNRGLFFNQTSEDDAEIEVFDVIGESFFGGFSEAKFSNELKKAKGAKTLTIKINSPGGFVDSGMTMLNLLSEFEGKIITKNMGLAASAAADLMMGGDERQMFDNAMFMVHEAFALMIGNADEMRKEADILDKVNNAGVKVFVNRTGLDEEKVRQLLKDETFMEAEEAKELGFIDTVIESKKKSDVKNFITKFQASAQKTETAGSGTVKEFRWQDAIANTNQLPEGSGHLDFNLRVNKQIYPITKEKFLMLGQFVQLSGKDNPDDALAYFTDLKGKKVETKIPADMLELQTKVDTLEQTVKTKNSVMESIQRKQSLDETNGRISRIESLVESKRIEPSDAKPLYEAYTEIDPATVGDTQRDADHDLKFYESLKPREDLLELEKIEGSGGKGKDEILDIKNKDFESKFTVAIKALIDGDKIKNFEQAYQEMKKLEPELVKKYEGV